MAKTHKRLFARIVDFQNLLLASRRAQQGRRFTSNVLAFNLELEANLIQLRGELCDRTYRPGPYRDFIVQDSKKRLISAAPYRDRVVHHAVMSVIEPLFDRSFIADAYACRVGKGTHAALARFRFFLGRHRYVLKCDIRKYFQSMDHELLLAKLARRIADPDAMWLLTQIVESRDFNAENPPTYFPGDDLFAPHVRRRGIPVGNLTSQFFANLYLDDFDHWLKEERRVGPYLRYVDDFCVFGDDKRELNAIRAEMVERLAALRLRMHDGKSRLHTLKEGVEFLGFRHLPGTARVRKENTKRFRSRMRRLEREYASGAVGLGQVRASVTSWIAHASYGSTSRLREQLIPQFVFEKGGKAAHEPRVARRFLEQ